MGYVPSSLPVPPPRSISSLGTYAPMLSGAFYPNRKYIEKMLIKCEYCGMFDFLKEEEVKKCTSCGAQMIYKK